MAPKLSANSQRSTPPKCKNMMYAQQVRYLPAKTKEDLINIIETRLKPKRYAVIVHNKEMDENGNPQEPDIHVMLCFANARSLAHIAKQLADKPQYIQKWDENANNGFAYLIHATETARKEGKYQYDPSEVTANFDFAALVQKDIPAEIARATDKRSGKVTALLDGLLAGVYTIQQVEDQLSGSQYGRYRRQIEAVWAKRLKNLATEWRAEKQEQGAQIRTIWICGASGTGKTSLAKEYARRVGQEYFVSGSSRDIFQGYSGEHTIILDELRPGTIPYGDFLRMTAPWGITDQVMAPARYADKALACDLYIITAPMDPYVYYREIFPSSPTASESYDSFDQLLRRLALVIEMDNDLIKEMRFEHQHVFLPTGVCYSNPYSRKARPPATSVGADLLRDMLGGSAPIQVADQEENKNPFDRGSNDDGYGGNEF